MKIDGYWNAAFFAVILIFSLGMASLGTTKSSSLIGYSNLSPTPFKLPTLPPGNPTATITPGGPTLTPNPNTPTSTSPPNSPTASPKPPTATPPPPTATPTSAPCNIVASGKNYPVGSIVRGPDSAITDTNRKDIRLSLDRTYTVVTNQSKSLTIYNGPAPDSLAPQFYNILGGLRTIQTVYRVDPNENASYPVNLVGFATSPGQDIKIATTTNLPAGIGFPVLYARSPELTIGYTTTDGITNGYTLFIEGVCVDPSLQNQYISLSNRASNQLPYVNVSDIVGKAQGTEVRIGIRDTGTLLDPRSCRDWWQANWNSGTNTCF